MLPNFLFTPETDIDFVFVLEDDGKCREITGKTTQVTELYIHTSNPENPLELKGIVIRMEDPAHPGQCWIFNSWKIHEDGVPFRKFQYLPSKDGEKLVGIGYHYLSTKGVEKFVEEYRKSWEVRGKPKDRPTDAVWTVNLTPSQIYCVEEEMIRSSTCYESPFGKNYD